MEKLSDILREMREEAREDCYTPDGLHGQSLNYYADRIEAAHEREVVTNRNALNTNPAENVNSDAAIYNNAKMREAMKYLRDASREFCHLILNSKYNEVFDKYKHAEVSKIRDAIANAGLVLAAPPRNCDVYDLSETKKEYENYRTEICLGESNPFIAQDKMLLFDEWLFAEAKGGAE